MSQIISTAPRVKTTAKRAGGTQYSELLNKVRSAGLLKKTPAFYVDYFIIISLLSLATWAGVILFGVFFHNDFVWQLFGIAIAAIQGALTAQYAFIGHELAHNQVFAKNKWNERAGLVVANLFAGLSYGFWLSKHNRHHAKPNMVDGDPDINLRILAFSTEQKFLKNSTERLLTKNQGWLFPVLSFFTAGDLLLDSIKSLSRKEGRGANMRWIEASLLLVRFLVPIAMFLIFFHPLAALISWVVYMLAFGFFMGNAFAVNHIGMPLVEKDSRIGFLERQVLTSRNIRPSWFMDAMMGGLNYQVEHHLFPSMPRPHLKETQRMVREFCHEKNIKYTETSFVEGYAQVLRYLNEVGVSTSVDPFMCPMVSMYRPIA